jgi:hypothetical protein
MNSHPSPRGRSIVEYIKSIQRQDTQLDRENFADKGRDTLLDGYTSDQFKDLCVKLWGSSADSIKPELYLRTLVDQLLGHYLLARGGDRRAAEISDIHTFEFPNEGVTPCFPLIMTMRASKTNQHSRLETMGVYQNKDPLVCPLGVLGCYLLYRWDLTEEPFPEFSARPRWYNTCLLKAGNATKEMAYNTQRQWIAKAFGLINLASSKKTHLFYNAHAKLAELKGIAQEQIECAGRWN